MAIFAVVPLVGTWIEILTVKGSQLGFNVVPLVGTWIEIQKTIYELNCNLSFPLWERGLKSLSRSQEGRAIIVVPLVGTWIEILNIEYLFKYCLVVPLVGTWIEIWMNYVIEEYGFVVPLVGPWIEININQKRRCGRRRRSPCGNVD